MNRNPRVDQAVSGLNLNLVKGHGSESEERAVAQHTLTAQHILIAQAQRSAAAHSYS